MNQEFHFRRVWDEYRLRGPSGRATICAGSLMTLWHVPMKQTRLDCFDFTALPRDIYFIVRTTRPRTDDGWIEFEVSSTSMGARIVVADSPERNKWSRWIPYGLERYLRRKELQHFWARLEVAV